MKKLLAVLMTVLMMVGLVACSNGEQGTTDEPSNEPSTASVKVGLGVSNSTKAKSATEDGDGSWQADITYALVVLDGEGKITKVDLDVAQNSVKATTAGELSGDPVKTKEEKKEEYNMKGASPIGKEWYEQAEAFEKYCVGKTVEEVTGMKLDAENHNGPVDLKSECTMDVTAFIEAIKNASTNAKEVSGVAKTGVASVTTFTNSNASEDADGKAQIASSIAAVALDADGKLLYADVEESQQIGKVTTAGEVTGETIPTKTDRKEDYNMKGASPIGKEWYEQMAAFETYLLGKTSADISGMKLDAENHNGPVDLKSECTMSVQSYNEALVKAIDKAN